ncbi:MAG TPA: hypothetical protein VE132_06665 [Micromonosporaceae bacterium]|nr:hypothetical protein [Micromonosporaceae bacterium]
MAETDAVTGNSVTASVAAGAAGGNASVDAMLVGFVAAAGAEIDRLFRAAMEACARSGGAALRDRYGAGYGELLIDFRSVLAAPDGIVTAAELAEVMRYHDQAEIEVSIRRAEGRGAVIRDDHGQIRATPTGHAFFDDLYATQADALNSLWADADEPLARLTAITGEIVVAASLNPLLPVGAFTAMTPNYEPVGTPASVLLLNRLSALRYHRSDAHAIAWRSAGLSATEMVAIQESSGSQRDAIEARTNEIAAAPFRILAENRRAAFLADLRSMPVPD